MPSARATWGLPISQQAERQGGLLRMLGDTSALIIAIVAFLEAFAVAHAVAPPPSDEDSHGGGKIVANKELIALGLANLTGTFCSHFPVIYTQQ